MISVFEAKKIIVESTKSLDNCILSINNALGSILAKDVLAPVNLPGFAQSAMDGYAISMGDLAKERIPIVGEIQAGSTSIIKLEPGTCYRIFTGAPVPIDADLVIMQEKTNYGKEWLIIEDKEGLIKGMNIRGIGEEILKASVALPKGTYLNAASIGFLGTMGVLEVEVVRKPEIAILITGDELVKGGHSLQHGQVYESNGITLENALRSTGFNFIKCYNVKDDFEATTGQIETALDAADLVIISGGISVGDYDFVGKALIKLGAKELFYKIRQKPGKPMYYGKLKSKQVFALPGNPASMLTCFYEYVLPALNLLSGQSECFMNQQQVWLKNDIVKKGDRAQFLRGSLSNNEVEVLDGQSSFMMQAFAKANCLIYLPEEEKEYKKGEKVEVHRLPNT